MAKHESEAGLTSNETRPVGASILVAVLFLIIVGASVVLGKVPKAIVWYYLVCSVVTFILYAKDKAAARKGLWRTPEKTLHLLSLIGGWPGALVAQRMLRHKSQKESFRLVFWITVIVNVGVFAWLHIHNGQTQLQTIMKHIGIH